MAIVVNGVSLPDIPADVLAQYPYSVVGKFSNLGSDMYVLYLSDRIYFYADMTLFGDTGEVIMSLTYNADGTTGGVCYTYSPDGNPEWIDVTSLFMESFGNGFYLGVSDQNYIPYAEYSLVWANHDVLAMVDMDYTTFEPILGDVYFPDSSTVYAEVYAVKSDKLRTLSQQVRRVCGLTDSKITVDEMLESLENMKLQEKTVTPTDTEQTVTPDTGYYGLSKVTVGAASGTTLPSNAKVYYYAIGVGILDDIDALFTSSAG